MFLQLIYESVTDRRENGADDDGGDDDFPKWYKGIFVKVYGTQSP